MKEYPNWQIKRNEAYKNGSLPSCFIKIKYYFYNSPCPICNYKMRTGRHQPTIQHNIPISKGGKYELNNISIVCKECNISLRDTETGSLNNADVIDVWQRMIEQGVVHSVKIQSV